KGTCFMQSSPVLSRIRWRRWATTPVEDAIDRQILALLILHLGATSAAAVDAFLVCAQFSPIIPLNSEVEAKASSLSKDSRWPSAYVLSNGVAPNVSLHLPTAANIVCSSTGG